MQRTLELVTECNVNPKCSWLRCQLQCPWRCPWRGRCCHWQRGSGRGKRGKLFILQKPTKAKGDTTRYKPPSHIFISSCSFLGSCSFICPSPGAALIIFMMAQRKESKEKGGSSSVDGGYKMSISSNNAIDKLRQLRQLLLGCFAVASGKQQKAAINENYVGREENWGGGDGIAGWRVASEASGKFVQRYATWSVSCCWCCHAGHPIERNAHSLTQSCPAASTVK